MIEVILVYASAILLGLPLGRYLAGVMSGEKSKYFEAQLSVVESLLYRLVGANPREAMGVRHYVYAFLLNNLVLALLVFLMFSFQAVLPLNPNQAPNMSWDLALHTMISFLTNTNQQHYSGQAQLSYLSHMTGIVGLQFVTPIMGLAIATATLRRLTFKSNPSQLKGSINEPTQASVGNYWADLIRPAVRFFLPLCLVWTILLVVQGVPATFEGGPIAKVLDSQSEMREQKIPLGPVAPMVAIKQLGTNGGGWYGPNSTVPLENPTPFSNFLQTLALIIIPVSIAFMIGPFTGRPKFALLVLGVMLTMSVISTSLSIYSESASGFEQTSGLMEGKEQRFTTEASALWSALTTQTSNGSVNTMHDSMAPLTGMLSILNMLVNSIWGGIGCGLQQFMVYLLLSVFLSGLMTGRTPELFGRKIEAREITLLGVLILLQPIVLLVLTAITFANPELSGVSNPGFHGLSQVFYEYTSAFANNGSGFEGLGDATVWWNLSTSLVLLLGRYPALIIPLLVVNSMASKRQSQEGEGVLKVESFTFALTLMSIVGILTLLQFMPVLVLGPIADHFSLMN